MRSANLETSACRHCRYYTPVGRRGGSCQQLNVPVKGMWKSCSLAIPPFVPSWEHLEEMMSWPEEILIVPEAITHDLIAKK